MFCLTSASMSEKGFCRPSGLLPGLLQYLLLEGVVGDDAAGVADHMGVALLKAEHPGYLEAGVHAGSTATFVPGGTGRLPLVNADE